MIASLLSYYATLVSYIETTTQQMVKTWQSIQCSFKNNKLVFLRGSNIGILSSAFFLNDEDIKDSWEWSYENGVFQENTVDICMKKKSLPWLSMSLCHIEGVQIDITSWLENIVYFGDRPPSLEVIIQAWSYDVGYRLKGLQGYSVKVMNELADEEEHHLRKHA